MPARPITLRLTKRNLPKEDRKSKQLTDTSTNAMLGAVIEAAKVSRFYRNHIDRCKASGDKIFIMERDAIQILGQMKNQRLYICDQLDGGTRTIHAASMLWDYVLP